MSDVAEDAMTIDELAQRTGMTVRNIRAHQSRGLLPPPEVRGRTGYYNDEHVARIELIKEMQADGFNLGAIARLLENVGESSAEVLDFTRAVRAPFQEEQPEVTDAAGTVERWGQQADQAQLERAVKLGLLRPLGDDRYEVRSPRLQRAAAELADLGVPTEAALEVAAKLRRHSKAVARGFVELFLENVWEPFDRAGRPAEEWPRVQEALERLRPLASESLLAMFQLVMTEAVEDAMSRTFERDFGERAERRGRRSSRRRGPGRQSSRA
ncbi:MAG: MerR family transcriptional regulator [Actinomycetota bacterium]